jgi:hypothetical protein
VLSERGSNGIEGVTKTLVYDLLTLPGGYPMTNSKA